MKLGNTIHTEVNSEKDILVRFKDIRCNYTRKPSK